MLRVRKLAPYTFIVSLSVAAFQSFTFSNSMASLEVFGMVMTFPAFERLWVGVLSARRRRPQS